MAEFLWRLSVVFRSDFCEKKWFFTLDCGIMGIFVLP